MLFKHDKLKILILMLAFSTSLIAMDKPWYNSIADYAARNKGKIATGIGTAAALGSLYYGYQQGWFAGQQSGINSINSSNWRFEHHEDREFPAGNKSLLEIQNMAGDIDVRTYQGDTIRVHIHKRAETEADLNNIYADFTSDERRLLITTRHRVQVVKALINYKLLVPQNKIFALLAKTNSGNIEVDGIQRDVNAESSNGNLIIRNSNGNVIGLSKNGDITINRIMGNISAKTSNGAIKIGAIGGNATVESYNGNVQASNINGLLKVSTKAGDITAEQIRNAQVRSHQGNISVKANQGTFSGSTNMGNVSLDQDAIDQAIELTSTMGDVSLSASRINGPIQASTFMGNIRSDFQTSRNVQNPLVKLRTNMGNVKVRRK